MEDDEVEVVEEDENKLKELMKDMGIEDRVKIRERYRELIAAAQSLEDEVNMDLINDGIAELNRLMGSNFVLFSTEGSYDAEALKRYSELFRQKISDQKDEALQFNSDLYTDKLVSQIRALCDSGGNEDEYPTARQWSAFGKTVGAFLQRPPTFHYLYGSFAIPTEEGQATQRQPSQNQQAQTTQEPAGRRKGKQRDELAPLTQPRAVINASDVNESEETTKLVDLVWKRMKVVYEQNNRLPISYFEFVLDPECFTQTVENMFYVSFLVKDGKVGIELEPTGLPVLRMYDESGASSNAAGGGQCNQCIMTLDRKLWKELTEAFKM